MVREKFRNYDLYIYKAEEGYHFEGKDGENHGNFIIATRLAGTIKEVKDKLFRDEMDYNTDINDNGNKHKRNG